MGGNFKLKKDTSGSSFKMPSGLILALKEEQLRRLTRDGEEPTYAELVMESWSLYRRLVWTKTDLESLKSLTEVNLPNSESLSWENKELLSFFQHLITKSNPTEVEELFINTIKRWSRDR